MMLAPTLPLWQNLTRLIGKISLKATRDTMWRDSVIVIIQAVSRNIHAKLPKTHKICFRSTQN